MLHFLLGLSDISEPNGIVSLGSLIYIFLGGTWFSVLVSLLCSFSNGLHMPLISCFIAFLERGGMHFDTAKSPLPMSWLPCGPLLLKPLSTVTSSVGFPQALLDDLYTHFQASMSLLARAFVTSVLILHIAWSCSFLGDLIEQKFSLKDPIA